MEKLDLTKIYKTYYKAKPSPELVDIEPARFISICGKGDPSGQEYAARLQALYAAAYTLKFDCKALGKDFAVSRLEGLWDFDTTQYGQVSMTEAPLIIPRSEWNYRMMIRIPGFVTGEQVRSAVNAAIAKKQLPYAGEVEAFGMHEGKSVQVLHVGPFSTEPETLLKIQQFVLENQLEKNGLHHEIYLSDFRKTPPERLKTILREPVKGGTATDARK